MKILSVILAALFVFIASPRALAAEGIYSFTLGDAKITALQDASGEMPLSIFSGAPESEMRRLAPSGAVKAGVTVFLIQRKGQNILVDTGYGAGKGALLSRLAQIGLKPANIHLILLTHMHGDHIGGLIDNGKAVFSKAKVVVSARELEYWTEHAAPEFAATAEKVKTVQAAYGKRLQANKDEAVTPEIRAVPLVGHTPGHTAYLLTTKDKEILFWGDIVHGADLQFPLPKVCAKYDMDPEMAVESRVAAMNVATEGEALKPLPVAGAHLPFPAVVRVTRTGDAFGYIPGP